MSCCFDSEKGCSALTVKICESGQNCAFYKTREDQLADVEKVYARLSQLSRMSQDYIAGTYYSHKRVWARKPKRGRYGVG